MEEDGAGRDVGGTEAAARGGLAGFWMREEALSILLLLLAIQLFVLPIVGLTGVGFVGEVVFSLLLVSGVAAVATGRFARWATGALVLVALVLEWSGLAARGGVPRVLEAAVAFASLMLFAVSVLVRTLSPGPITRHRIEGAVAAYLLVGVACGLGYELVEIARPGSFDLGGTLEGEALRGTFGYFSLVTLTTLGYGDVTPLSAAARALATFEGVVGQLYPAILIGWMVASLPTRQA